MNQVSMDRRAFLRGAGTTIGLLAAGGVLSACGGSATPAAAVDPDATPEQRAEAERELLFYMTATDYQPFLDGFAAAYPWAETHSSIGTPGDNMQKVQTEFTAKAPTADIVLLNAAQRSVLVQGDVLQPLRDVPNTANYDQGWADPDGLTFSFIADPRVVAYNTNLLGSTPLVEDIYELADPQYRDKIVFDKPQNYGTSAWWLSSQRAAWGDAKWMQWLEGLKANNVLIASSASNGFQSVITGERVFCVTTMKELVNNPQAPIAANFYANMVLSPLMLAAPAGAAHPNVAALFVNWVLSEEGQATAGETGATPVIGSTLEADLNLPPHASLSAPSQNQAYVDDPDSFMEIYNELWPA